MNYFCFFLYLLYALLSHDRHLYFNFCLCTCCRCTYKSFSSNRFSYIILEKSVIFFLYSSIFPITTIYFFLLHNFMWIGFHSLEKTFAWVLTNFLTYVNLQNPYSKLSYTNSQIMQHLSFLIYVTSVRIIFFYVTTHFATKSP